VAARGDIEDIYPLCDLQEGMLFHVEMAPASPAYWNQLCFTLEGSLDPERLRLAWQYLVDRHAVYRTSITRDRNGRPMQVVRRSAELPWRFEDWSESPIGHRRIERLSEELLAAKPKLTSAPLFNVCVIKLGGQRHRMLWTVHHLIQDGWSSARVLDELFVVYAALGDGRSPDLPPPIPYRRYVEHELSANVDRLRERWGEYLRDMRPLLLAAPSENAENDFESAHRDLGVDETRSLVEFARINGLTLSAVVQAAWALTLAAESGQSDVVFGVTAANRPPDLEGADTIVGLMLTTVPARLDTGARTPVADWIKAHQRRFADLSGLGARLSDIQRWSGEDEHGLFDTLLVFENYPLGDNPGDPAGLVVGEFSGYEHTNYPITLTVQPGDDLHFLLSVDRARFEPARGERILERLTAVLRQLIACVGVPVTDLEWLLPSEVPYRAGRAVNSDPHILTLIRQSTDRTPDRVAVSYEGASLTYAELWQRAEVIAGGLTRRGVAAGDLVGVCVARDADLPAVLMAVWRVGAAYVPLDPGFPVKRLEAIVADARPRILLTSERTEALGRTFDCSVSTLDDLIAHGEAAASLGPLPEPDGIAYVIYTSGSTGTPKGVAIRHASVSNFLLGMRELVPIGPEDRLLAVTTVSFDIALLELFLPLLVGGSTQLLPTELSRDADAIAERLGQATVMQATPATWQLLIESGWSETDPTRLLALCGGEALPRSLADGIKRNATRLWNLYGPTETTVWSTAAEVADAGPIVIGTPIRGTTCSILDEHGRALPPGVKGELAIGGIGVAQGYLNREDLSAERFVRARAVGGERVFRTGDLAWLDAEGRLTCFGRGDRQVKIRGFRLELDEVEAVLMRHPSVERAAVIVRDTAGGGRSLLAFCATNETVPADEILAEARQWLPSYMVPSRLELMADLPLTPNLKVDRAALAAAIDAEQDAREFASADAPQTEMELAVAAQWCAVLGLAEVGVNDNFFALGGDSLRFARLSRRLRDLVDVMPPLNELYTAQSVAAQVSLLGRAETGAELPPIQRSNERDRFPASPFQERLWMLEQFDDAAGAHNVIAAFRTSEPLDEFRLGTALARAARRHEILRTTLALRGEHVEQVVLPTPTVNFAVVTLGPDGLPRALEELGHQVFDLADAPPWNVRLLRGLDHDVLVGCFHHSIFDGSSADRWIEEVIAEYDRPSSEEPLEPLQFGDYASWLNALRPEVLAEDRRYWSERLKGELPTLDLPHFRPRPALQSHRGAMVQAALSSDLVAGLTRAAAEQRTSLNVMLLAGYVAVLQRYANARELVVGTLVDARPFLNLEQGLALEDGLGREIGLGPFVNTLPLRIELPDDCDLTTLVGHVHRVQSEALAHQILPFEHALAELDVARDSSRTPVFQTLFSVQRDSDARLRSSGIGVERVSVPTKRARTDISCFVQVGSQSMDDAAGASIQLEFACDVYDEWLMRQMLDHLVLFYRRLGEGGSSASRQPMAAIPLLDAGETGRVIHDAQPEPKHDQVGTVLDLIDWAAHADAIAVADESSAQTYAQLASRSDHVAGNLLAAGVAAGDCVAICVSRSADLVALVLGIWKAGGFYLPLDPDLPEARRRFILTDAKARFIVGEPGLVDSEAVTLEPDALLRPAAGAVPSLADRLARAYLIYTSGSTGQPKGVLVGHAQVVNFLLGMRDCPGLRPGEVMLACTTVGFDISVLELFLPLAVGARVHVAPTSISQDPRALERALETREVTTLQATPSAWRMLIQSGWQGDGQLRAFVGGEALTADLAGELTSRCGEVWNLYGPTETTVWSSCQRIRSDAPPTIGRPIRNTRMYVVDALDQPVPDGLTGELLIGGDGVAEGYWQRPELDRERFTRDPFVDGRVFRTGDLVRRLPDGEIEYIGRSDNQVKLRGHRIELDEVAAVARRAASVENACAIVIEYGEDDRRLVTYVQTDDPGTFVELDLLKHMRRQLPAYMVPQQIMPVRKLPLTASGKLDRGALPKPKPAAPTYVAPESADERALAEIWSQVLGTSRVGRNDRFFDLGGHSMLAMHVVLRVERELGVAMSPNVLVMEDLAGVASAIAEAPRPIASGRIRGVLKRIFGS
jgi:amino acid adenylation domain-containing protein